MAGTRCQRARELGAGWPGRASCPGPARNRVASLRILVLGRPHGIRHAALVSRVVPFAGPPGSSLDRVRRSYGRRRESAPPGLADSGRVGCCNASATGGNGVTRIAATAGRLSLSADRQRQQTGRLGSRPVFLSQTWRPLTTNFTNYTKKLWMAQSGEGCLSVHQRGWNRDA